MLEELTLYIEDAFSDINDNRQLFETVRASVPERLRQYVNVGGRHFEHFR
jgi:hypothetical protein